MSSRWADRISQALGLRLAAWYLGTFLASTLLMGGLTYGLLASLLEARDHDIIQSTLREYATRYQAGGLAGARQGHRDRTALGRARAAVRPRRRAFPGCAALLAARDLGRIRPGRAARRRPTRSGRRSARAIATPCSRSPASASAPRCCRSARPAKRRNQLLSNFRRVLSIGAGVALMIGVVGGVFLTRSTLKPLRELRDAVRRILQTGQTDDRVPVYGTDDAVDELSHLFNAMLARITTLIHGMRNALDHVAHDLRTPMTRLRVKAESALAEQRSRETARGVVRLSRGKRARAVDAHHADGHLRGRDRHDEAQRVARRSGPARRRSA